MCCVSIAEGFSEASSQVLDKGPLHHRCSHALRLRRSCPTKAIAPENVSALKSTAQEARRTLVIWDVDNIPLPAMLLHAGIDALLPEEALLQSRFVAVSNPSTYRAHMRKETGWTWCTVPSHMRNRADVEMRSILYDEIKTLQLALASPCLPRTLFVLVSNDNGFVADVKWAKHSGCCVWVIGSLRTKGPTAMRRWEKAPLTKAADVALCLTSASAPATLADPLDLFCGFAVSNTVGTKP